MRDIVFPDNDKKSNFFKRLKYNYLWSFNIIEEEDVITKVLKEEEEERNSNDWVDYCHQLEVIEWK